ncbi:phage tail protein [Streptomyces shenzhenensis]|uniref:phage tail protein n=1 Tax=Streptomyces shenzhenensis TaxID=943815 RepID=UPI0034100DCE
MKAASEKPAKPTASARSASPAPERTPAPTPTPAPSSEETSVPTPAGRGLTPRSLQRLQGAAGNAAVSRLVAQRYAAPVKPPASQAPGMRRVNADIAAKKQKLATHRAATAESRSAQGAAKAPPDDKQAQGKAANAEKMNAAEPGEFDKAAFIAAVNDAIDAQAPKNLDEADKFADSGKADEIKGAVDGKVTEGKESSAQDIETTTTAAPDTSQAKEKQVTPMTPDQPPADPGAPDAADAVPQQQPPEVTDFSEGPRRTDQQLAEADVTEEQLARSNEPQFTEALGEKKRAEQHSATAPGQARAAEKQQLATAKAGAAAAGATAMAALTAKRGAAGREVDGGKGETKSKDEQKREEVTAKLQRVFDATQKDVKEILDGLDGKVDRQFEEGEKRARDAFNTDQKRRMKEYKDKRYGGFFGPAKWAKDKLMGMPEEANQLFQESRRLYVRLMQGVISSIADMIGRELGRAKARITRGRTDLKAEVDKLPADLRQFGEEAAQDFAAKFDDLEAEVDDKSQELVQSLAQKYTQALNAVDEEIKKLQEANKGLVQKAVDAVVSVVRTIKELKDLLMGVLAKAASAITKIIKDPIGFLGNLVRSVGAGLQQFVSNIATHLQSGLVSWLLGTSVKAGIEIPARFDLKGIIQIIASLLGLTWANIRARITRKGVPDQAMTEVEQSVPVAKALATEGPAGATKEIQAEVGDVKSTILEEVKSYLIPTVIVAGITWILSLLNPASAFIRAVKAIIDIVTFIVTQGAQIVEFVNAVLDAVIAIANGGSAGVPKTIETALAASIPLLIGLLASLLGIGGLANKIRQAFQKVSRPVNRAIDRIAARIAQAGRRIWSRIKQTGRRPGDEKRRHQPRETEKRSETVRKQVEEELRKVLPPGVDPESVDSRLRGVYRKYSRRGLHGLRLVPDRGNPLSFVVLVSASSYKEGHSGEAQKELESNAFDEFLKLNPKAQKVYEEYEKARQEMLETTQIQVDNLRLKTRDGQNGEEKVHGKDTPTTATGILTIGSGKEYKMGEFPSRAAKAAEKNGENHSEAQLLRFMFDRWTVYTHDDPGGGSAHLELNVTRTPCFEFCTPKIVDARSGKDSMDGKNLPAGWTLDITVNAMSVYHGARENKKGEMYGGRKKSIEALKSLVKAGVRLGMWTPGSESLITAWASGELKMYPKDGGVMSPPTRDELREANIKLYRVLKELIYVPNIIGQDAYDAMLVEVPSSGGGKRKLLKVPFAR